MKEAWRWGIAHQSSRVTNPTDFATAPENEAVPWAEMASTPRITQDPTILISGDAQGWSLVGEAPFPQGSSSKEPFSPHHSCDVKAIAGLYVSPGI